MESIIRWKHSQVAQYFFSLIWPMLVHSSMLDTWAPLHICTWGCRVHVHATSVVYARIRHYHSFPTLVTTMIFKGSPWTHTLLGFSVTPLSYVKVKQKENIIVIPLPLISFIYVDSNMLLGRYQGKYWVGPFHNTQGVC